MSQGQRHAESNTHAKQMHTSIGAVAALMSGSIAAILGGVIPWCLNG